MWKRLQTDDLKKILSDDEVKRLTEVSTDNPQVVQDAIDLVADMVRGAFRAKGFQVDSRDHYLPDSYALPALQYARYVAWSRFPNSPYIALDEVRRDVEMVKELLQDPWIDPEPPDDPPTPEQGQSGSIVLPFLRFDEQARMFAGEGKLW